MSKKWSFLLILALIFATNPVWGESPVLSGLVKHVDAGAITGLNDGDPVTVWEDLSGNGNLEPYAESPTYKTGVINGLPVVRFNGDGGLTAATEETLFSGDQPHTVFIVAIGTEFTGSGNAIWQIGRNAGGKYSSFNLEGELSVGNRMGNGYNKFIPDPPYALGGSDLFVTAYSGGGYSNYALAINGAVIEGSPNNPGNKMSMDNSTIRLGNRDNKDVTFNGDVAEFLVFNRLLNEYEVALVGSYLAEKYALTTSYTDPGPYTVAVGPADGADQLDTAVTFEWEGANGTDLTYVLNYRDVNSEDPNTEVVTTETSHAVDLAMNTTYEWHVDIQDGNKGTTQQFTTAGLASVNDPADGADGIEQDLAELSWNEVPLENILYRVNFGTTDPPAQVAETTDLSYALTETLDPNTMYYWSIDTARGNEVVTGDIWSFASGGLIGNPYPADDSGGNNTQLTLTWDGDRVNSFMNSFDVYIGESPASLQLVATVSDTAYEIPEAIPDNATRYWQIVGKNDDTVIDGSASPVWSFTTGTLVSYWPFDGDLTDTIGGQNGTQETSSFGTGVIGEGMAAEFFGALPIMTVPTTAVGESGNFSITCWEYSDPDAGSGGWETILGMGPDNNGWNTFEFGRLDIKRYVWGFGSGGYKYTPNDDSYSRGEWHFHALSYDDATGTILWYVNGVLVNTYAGHPVLEDVMTVGSVKETGNQWFFGKIDDLKLYNRPIGDAEILNEYVNGVGGAPILPSPLSGTRGVPWDLTLEWVASEDATGHTIEIGKMSDLSDATPIELAADVRSFNVVDGLGYKLDVNSEYYWRITSELTDGPVAGSIWFFAVRDLNTDLNGDLRVDSDDLNMIAAKWLDDTSAIPPTQYNIIDQEVWSTTGDPNIADYDRYVTPGGAWGESLITLKTDPTPGDENYTPPSQTLIWTAFGGGQQLCGINFVNGEVNFNDFDKMGFWAYGKNTGGNFQLRAKDESGNSLTTKTITGMNEFDNQWHNYEWDIADDAPNVHHYDIWVSDDTFTWEWGHFYLKKNDNTVKLCLTENLTNIEDLNQDCMVNLLDFTIMVQDWFLDASN